MEVRLAHNWGTFTWIVVKSIFKTWSLCESMKELWLFTCLNTKTIVWGPNCQHDRSKVRCCPGSGPRGCQAKVPWWGYSAGTRRHLGGFVSQPGCLQCSFWEVAEIPPPLGQQGRLVWTCTGARRGSTASAGLRLVLLKPSDSLNLHLRNLDCADFTVKEVSLMSFRHEK